MPAQAIKVSGAGHVPTALQTTAPKHVRGLVQLWSPEVLLSGSWTTQAVVARHQELPQVTRERASGWRVVPRPKLRPIKVWDGYGDTVGITLKLLFDGIDDDAPVDRALTGLRDLGTQIPELDRPPRLKVVGKVPYPSLWWIIESLSIVETEHRDGACLQAIATIELGEHLDPKITSVVRKRAEATAKQRKHTWTRGDTLHALAETYLGDRNRAASIRRLNPGVKWGSIKPGTVIKIPSKLASS